MIKKNLAFCFEQFKIMVIDFIFKSENLFGVTSRAPTPQGGKRSYRAPHPALWGGLDSQTQSLLGASPACRITAARVGVGPLQAPPCTRITSVQPNLNPHL